MPEEFFLKTLGVPRLMTAAGHEIRLRVRKHLAVLVVLAVDGGRIRRDRLVAMFWPYSRPDRARGSLATAISYLRGKLGGHAIEPGRDFVGLIPGLVMLDLDRLETGEIIGDDFNPVLEVDGFLHGFELERLAEFESWRDRQHARLLPSIEKALVTLTDHSRRSGDITALGCYADKLLELNDLSEWGIKARMEAYALSGDRITALRVYDEWVERLRQELNISPVDVVNDLASRLRRRHWSQHSNEPPAPVVRTEQWRDRVFVGRTKEFRHLFAVWEHVSHGNASHLLIRGDSGVGKTTLADRFATILALEGASIARIRCYELESGIPYTMIGGVVETLLDRPGASGTSPDSLADLARILPPVKRRYPGLSVADEQSGESARIRFAEAALDLFIAVAAERPLFIVIDDYDQADEASLSVLHFLMRRLNNEPVVVLLTSRSGNTLTSAVSRIRFDEDLELDTVELDPLSEDESEILLDALAAEAGLQPSTTERRALLATAAGFPLALELLLRDWQHNGRRSTALAIRAMTQEVDANPENRYQQLANKLFADFDCTEQMVVNVAAILDRRVADLPLYEVSGVRQGHVLGTLSRMVDRRALRDGPHGLEWINPSLRAHAYLLIPKSIRRMLHEAIAGELLRQATNGASIPSLEIAWHCMRAGRTLDASAHLVAGARDAIIHGAPHEAELALTTGMSTIEGSYKQQATLLLGEALLELSRPAEAIDVLTQLPRLTDSHLRTVDLLLLRARDRLRDLDPAERDDIIRRICGVALGGLEPSTAALAVTTSASLLDSNYRSPLADLILRTSYSIDVTTLDPIALLNLLLSQAKLHYIYRRLDEATQFIERARQLAEVHSIRHSAFVALLNGTAAIAAARGEYETCLNVSCQQFTEAVRAGDDEKRFLAAANAALAHLRLGRYSNAIEWMHRGAVSGRAPDAHSIYTLGRICGVAYALLDDRNAALSAIEPMVAQCSFMPTLLQRRVQIAAADVLMIVGEKQRAFELASRVEWEESEPPSDFGILGATARWHALNALRDHREAEATKQIRDVLELPLDAMDRIEALAAIWTLGTSRDTETLELSNDLAGFPAALLVQLQRVGVLSTYHSRRHQPTTPLWKT